MMQYSQDIYFSVLLCCMHVCLLAPCYMHYFTCIMHHFMCNMHSILCAICTILGVLQIILCAICILHLSQFYAQFFHGAITCLNIWFYFMELYSGQNIHEPNYLYCFVLKSSYLASIMQHACLFTCTMLYLVFAISHLYCNMHHLTCIVHN